MDNTATTPLIGAKRDLLLKLGKDYLQKQETLVKTMDEMYKTIDNAISSEEKERSSLSQLKNQLDEVSLQNDYNSIQKLKSDLDMKLETYKNLVKNNDMDAAAIYDDINTNQQTITKISTLIDDINLKITEANQVVSHVKTIKGSNPTTNPTTPSAAATKQDIKTEEKPSVPSEVPTTSDLPDVMASSDNATYV